MKRVLGYGIFSLLVVSAGFLLISTGVDPIIYTPAFEPKETSYHTDIGVMKEISMNSSEDLLPVMQDLLDFSGTIAITIRKKDLETAGEDLARYQKRYQDLNNLILKLDMNQSEVAEFTRNAKQQNEILKEFINSSESLESLQKLEVQYRAGDNIDSLTTVKLQGKALERKLRSLRSEYDQVSDRISGQASSKGLDSQKVYEGKEAIYNFTREVAADQEDRDSRYDNSDLTRPAVSLLVEPSIAEYRESFDIFGFISGENTSFQSVWIVMDGYSVMEVKTDDTGLYRTSYEIGRISGGDHTIMTYREGTWSEPVMVTIPVTNTSITLGARAQKDRQVVNLTGILSAREPVKEAPVRVLVNNETWNTTITDGEGRYFTSLSLPAGTFSVSTIFDNSSFPLNGSASTVFEISSSGTSITSIVQSGKYPPDYRWISLLFIPLFALAAWWYVRRNRNLKEIPYPEDRSQIGSAVGIHSPGDRVSGENAPGCGVTPEGEVSSPVTVSDSAHLLYQGFITRIHSEIHASHPLTLTPRELEARFSQHPLGESIRVVIRLYERIRYGGADTREELDGFVAALKDIEIGGPEGRNED